jgi:formate/nitrite transporter FocA (FNT family)
MEIKANLDAVLVGRILAGVIIVVSFAYSVKAAASAHSDGFWLFLGSFATPLALSFVVIMATEILRELRGRSE